MAPSNRTLQDTCTETQAFQYGENIPIKETTEVIEPLQTPAYKLENIEGNKYKSDVESSDINRNVINEVTNGKNKIIEEETDYLIKETMNKNSNKSENDNSTVVTYNPKMRWPDLFAQLFLHLGCLYGFYLMLTSARFYTSLFALCSIYVSGFGITAGAHRLWSHRSYKAKWPMRLLLILLFTVTGQRDVYTWALDHRVHHKYTETDSDPHDSRRGFFFSHVGWLFLTPHPDVEMKRKSVFVKDLEADPIVMWQKKWFIPLFALLSIYLPVMMPVWFWQETIWNSFWVNFNCRFTVTLNIAFFVNSAAHMWGAKPYDKNISPVENIAVAIAALGEGWHNYHHVFPWDYKTAELGSYTYNITTAFIDFFAKVGWAYERKSVSPEMIVRRAVKSGDGSYIIDHHRMNGPALWGYGDTDMLKEDVEELKKMNLKQE